MEFFINLSNSVDLWCQGKWQVQCCWKLWSLIRKPGPQGVLLFNEGSQHSLSTYCVPGGVVGSHKLLPRCWMSVSLSQGAVTTSLGGGKASVMCQSQLISRAPYTWYAAAGQREDGRSWQEVFAFSFLSVCTLPLLNKHQIDMWSLQWPPCHKHENTNSKAWNVLSGLYEMSSLRSGTRKCQVWGKECWASSWPGFHTTLCPWSAGWP